LYQDISGRGFARALMRFLLDLLYLAWGPVTVGEKRYLVLAVYMWFAEVEG
jgi:hypothetical protein